jgi:predicted NBD/HSP70 family sugar kinase
MNIVIDIGGTKTNIGIFATSEIETLAEVINFPTPNTYKELKSEIVNQVGQVRQLEDIENILISHPGMIEFKRKVVKSFSNIPDFVGKPLVADLAEELKIPNKQIDILNDVVVAGLGQFFYGQHNGPSDNFIYMTVSTGVSSVNIRKVNGKFVIVNSEIGHNVISANNIPCPCGQTDCFEMYIGGKQLTKRFLRNPEKIDDLRIWERAVHFLGIAIINSNRFFFPDLVTLGGGIADNNKYLRKKLDLELKNSGENAILPHVRFSEFAEKVSLYGGIAYINNRDKIIF